MNNIYSEQDLDKLIASVEETLAKAEILAKSPADMQEDDQQAEAAPEAAGQEAPPQEAAPEAEAQAPEQQEQAPQEEQLEGESEDAPLSDEELDQIYGSMPPEELERHYSAIRQHMEAAYAKAEEEECEEEEKEEKEDKKEDKEEMEKSEKVAALEAKVAEQEKALENIAKAFEILSKPTRKAVTGIQFIQKSEDTTKKEYSKEDIQAWYSKTGPASLSKSEREQVNSFFLYGEGKEEIEKLINSKGGKQ